jgi:hypothetical protein
LPSRIRHGSGGKTPNFIRASGHLQTGTR